MGIFAIRSEDNNVTNRIVGSSGVRNARNERPPLRPPDVFVWVRQRSEKERSERLAWGFGRAVLDQEIGGKGL
jgi:hypothetical protein